MGQEQGEAGVTQTEGRADGTRIGRDPRAEAIRLEGSVSRSKRILEDALRVEFKRLVVAEKVASR